MNRLLELLARLAALLTDAPDTDRPLSPDRVSDEDLEALLSEFNEAYQEARQSDQLTVELIDTLTEAATAIEGIVAEENLRVEALSELETRAAEIDARVAPIITPSAEGDPEGDPDPEPVEDPPAAPEADPAPDPDPAPAADPVEDPAPVADPVSISASGDPSPRTPLTRLRVPATPAPRPSTSGPRVIAAAGVPGMNSGGEFNNRREVAEALQRSWDANKGASGDGVQVAVARIETPYPDDRQVSSGASAIQNTEVFRAGVDSFENARVAAGGICAPTMPLYAQAMISRSSRPVRDGLPSFQADRGGINWIHPPALSSIVTTGGSAAIGQVTAAQDLAGTTKTHQTVTCGVADSAQIYAVTNILEFGNMMGRTFPELTEAWIGLAEAAFSRFAENLLLTTIAAGSTAVTTQQRLGAARDVLNYADLAATAYRNRHRMDPNATLVAMFPAWIVAAIRADVWSGFNTGTEEAVTVTQARIEGWFAARNIRVIWFEDGVGPGNPAAQIFPAQAAGLLTGWPTVVQWYLFHEGAWLVLDGGTLDLGIVRDSTLNAANKYQMFFESFENVVNVGVESLRIRSTICVNGATSGTVAPTTICTGGS